MPELEIHSPIALDSLALLREELGITGLIDKRGASVFRD
jgi:hypothetical protein